MPLLVTRAVTPTPEPPPPITGPAPGIDITWISPSGRVLPMMAEPGQTGVRVRAGVEGFGLTPRSVTRQPLATGGSFYRWSHAEERLLVLPLTLEAEPGELYKLQREVYSVFAETAPTAGVPTPGTLRVTREDGSWREIHAVYLDGLQGTDEGSLGQQIAQPVLTLVAADPWWYGPNTVAAEFATIAEGRSYFNPYETVSSGRTLGDIELDIIGDAPVSPVWTVTGPAAVVNVRYTAGNPQWQLAGLDAGEVITINVQDYTVTDQDGNNRLGELNWPTSSLFTLAPGRNLLTITITGGEPDASKVLLEYRPRWGSA